MAHRIVILGGGTGGTIMANRLRRTYSPDEAEITVVDLDDAHVYQPGLLFVPFGLADAEHLVRPRRRQLHRDVFFMEAEVERVDSAAGEVHLRHGIVVGYDVLVIASGARLVPEETAGPGPATAGSRTSSRSTRSRGRRRWPARSSDSRAGASW